MTLTKLLFFVAIAGLIMTAITYFVFGKKKSILLSYLQNSVGALFLFSGWVKAVDPSGTAFKMEQYFAEFESTFSETWLSFIAPIFPLLSNYAIGFSVFMIILEFIIAFMLILGGYKKLTVWLYLGLIVFFTLLTGFTFLTGYVPRDANFFDFSMWGEYTSTNMRVTDCGCFGDFLVLDPKVSFLKDIILLIPGLIFLFGYKKMHTLFTPAFRNGFLGVSTALILLYCLSNFVWDIPHMDFRPFKNGVNIRDTKEAEQNALADVDVIGWSMIQASTGKVAQIMNPNYREVIKNYSKDDGWAVKDQIKTEPLIKDTKISEFDISNRDGEDVTEEILNEKGYSFWIINYKLPHVESYKTVTSIDTIFRLDSLALSPDSMKIMRVVDRLEENKNRVVVYEWDDDYIKDFTDKFNPVVKAGMKDGVKSIMLVKESGPDLMSSLQDAVGIKMPIYKGDDILLKTMVRSMPGLFLMKDGEIIQKWHKSKIPAYEEIKSKYIK